MLRLVMRHTYNNGRATDLSGRNNHGLPVATSQAEGAGPFGSALLFRQPDSEVRVAPSPSLERLDAIRLRVRFYWDGGHAVEGRRHNLVEGHLSFALFITPYGGLTGTIVDASGEWRGAEAPPRTVRMARWHEAELRHDGFSTLELRLDGVLVAAAYDVPGPVRGVGPKGVVVGHWPEPDPRYTFTGRVDEVELAQREIEPDDFLDPGCDDAKTLDEMLDEVRATGFTGAEARALLAEAAGVQAGLAAAVLGSDGTRADRLRDLSAQGAVAIQSGDGVAMAHAAAETLAFMRQQVPDADLRAFGQQAFDIMVRAPYGDLLQRFADGDTSALDGLGQAFAAFCLLTPTEPPRGGEDEVPTEDDRGGDPDTDAGPPSLTGALDRTLEPTPDPVQAGHHPAAQTREEN